MPPVELHTAPMGMKLGSYPGLGTDGLWCKGLAISPRQSATRSPHFSDGCPMVSNQTLFTYLAVVVPPVEPSYCSDGDETWQLPRTRYGWAVVQRASAIYASIGHTVAPFSDGDNKTLFTF